MWSDTQTLSDCDFKVKDVTDWNGNDCYNFATKILEGIGIPQGVWLHKDAFQFMVGKDILAYKEKDYVNILGSEYSRKFYQTVKLYLKSRKCHGKPKKSVGNPIPSSSPYEGSNSWAVPQAQQCLDNVYSRSLSPLLYSYPPPYAMLPGEAEGSTYANQNYSGSTYFADLASPDDNLDYSEEFVDYPGAFSFTPHKSEMFEPSTSDHMGYNELEEAGACGFSNTTYSDNPSLGHSYGSLSSQAAASCLPYEETDLGIENLIDRFRIGSPDFDPEERSEFDIYNPIENPTSIESITPSFMNPSENSSHFNEGAVVPDGSSLHEKRFLNRIVTGKRKNRTRNPKSWEFIVRLLVDPQTNPSLIKWEDKEKGIFRLVNKDKIARMWGNRTDKHKEESLSYENFARILRYHYISGTLRAVSEKHLVYQLGDAVIKSLKDQNLL